MALNLTEFENREAASEAAAAMMARALEADIVASGAASLMVSGGSTPERVFRLLSARDIEWAKVTVGLVDERWVAPDHPDSNERLVRSVLLKGRAAAARFIPMKTPQACPREAEADRIAAYAPFCKAPSFVLLGMGTDGHTASWFSGSPGLAQIAAADAAHCIAAIEASGAAVPQRMTLTGAGVLTAQRALLLVFGEEKRSMLISAPHADPMACPVRFAIDGLGERLSVYWAP